jgi:fatty acid desaturase
MKIEINFKNKKENLIKKKYDNLSIQDKLAFRELTKFKGIGIWWIVFPFYALFYLGVFGLVLKYAYGLDVLNLFFLLAIKIGSLWWVWITLFLFEILVYLLTIGKTKKKLLKIGEKEVIWKKQKK